MNKLKIAIGAVLAAGVALAFLLELQAQTRERERNRTLRQQVEELARAKAASRPLPPLVLLAKATSPLPGEQWRGLLRLRREIGVLRHERAEAIQLQADNSRMRSNWVEQLAGGRKLSLREVAPYLAAKQRNAESLLAAAHVTGDPALLREAVEKYPADPRVNYAACLSLKSQVPAEECRQRLEALKQSAPDNALADYLSARDYFKSGQTEQAIQELVAASVKPKFQDYRAEFVQDAEEAYRAAGLSSLEAAVAASGQPLPQLAELKGLSQDLCELAKRYREASDENSARAALQMGAILGRQVSEPAGQSLLISELVGMAIERQVLEALDPASPYDAAGHSVKDRLDELAQQRAARTALIKQGDSLVRNLSAPDLAGYYERLRTSGELEALRWAVSRQGGQ